MAYNNHNSQHDQTGNERKGNANKVAQDTFNELSEISLEERMAMADRIGVPVENENEAVATGTMTGVEPGKTESNERPQDENGKTDR